MHGTHRPQCILMRPLFPQLIDWLTNLRKSSGRLHSINISPFVMRWYSFFSFTLTPNRSSKDCKRNRGALCVCLRWPLSVMGTGGLRRRGFCDSQFRLWRGLWQRSPGRQPGWRRSSLKARRFPPRLHDETNRRGTDGNQLQKPHQKQLDLSQMLLTYLKLPAIATMRIQPGKTGSKSASCSRSG